MILKLKSAVARCKTFDAGRYALTYINGGFEFYLLQITTFKFLGITLPRDRLKTYRVQAILLYSLASRHVHAVAIDAAFVRMIFFRIIVTGLEYNWVSFWGSTAVQEDQIWSRHAYTRLQLSAFRNEIHPFLS